MRRPRRAESEPTSVPARAAALLAERSPAVLVVTGPAGVGRSTLVAALVADAALAARPVLRGSCSAAPGGGFPLAPVVEALAAAGPALPVPAALPAVTGTLRGLLPELAHLLPELGERLPTSAEPSGRPDSDGGREGDERREGGERREGDRRREVDRRREGDGVREADGAVGHREFRGLTALLDAVGPVLVLEDLHAADAPTLAYLRHLIARLPARVGLVLTARATAGAEVLLAGVLAEAGPSVTVEEIRLTPLGATEVGELARRLLGTERVTPEFAAEVRRRSAGLPGVAAALITAAGRGPAGADDPVAPARALDALPVPPAVRRRVLGEIAALEPAARELVDAAAVLERPAEIAESAAVAGITLPRAAPLLRAAADAGLLAVDPEGRFVPAYPAVRAAVYAQLTPERRRELHLRAARRIRSDPGPDRAPLEELYRHHRAAGSPGWPRLAEAAADRAQRAGLGARAVDLLTEAAEHATGARRARLALKAGRAALTGLPDERTVALLRSVLAEPGLRPEHRGEIGLHLGLLLRNQAGSGAAGRTLIAEAIHDLAHAPELAARAMSALSVPAIDGWPFARHLSWMTRAEELATGVDDPVMRITVRANRAATLMFTGDPLAWRAVRELPDDPGSSAERQHLLRARANLAHATLMLGHPKSAARFVARAEELLRGAESPYYAGLVRTAGLLLDWTGGHWEGLAVRAEAVAGEYADIPVLAAEATLVRGLLELTGGRTGTARRLLEQAAATVRLDTGVVTAGAAGALCRLDLANGHPERAWDRAARAVETVRRVGAWVWGADVVPAAVEALLGLGEAEAAEALTEEFADGVAGRDAPAARAAVEACRAVLAEERGAPGRTPPPVNGLAERTGRGEPADGAAAVAEAVERWTVAERAWARAGRPYEEARARLARGRVRLTADGTGTEDVLTAVDRFAALGAHGDLALARRLLKEHGITPPTRGGRPGYGDALSPREREVAVLAAGGLGNAEIADRLVLSRRTVEHHVAGAMRKLSVTSRTALAAALSDR
ncbi:LuxR C-terminal-related transcriptional regulator [Streptomyces sp. NBC_00090]|uniref:LuxR C-terminal-related transcriptional regulator n=1 Tax=Streptomyces sp. NBC_00090 TaxID=2903619 RepID=UPI00324A3D33